MHPRKIAVAFSLFLLLVCGPARAAIYSWSGNGATANWTDSGNWGFAGTPTNGDTVIFPAGQPLQSNTNNISNLTLAQIRFVGAGGGYNILGNPITLTDSIQATNTAGANSISNAITLSGQDIIINVATNSSLTVSGVVSGVVGLIKNGPGTLTFAGPLSNIYGGLTTVNAGFVFMEKSGSPPARSIPGDLIVGDGTNVTIMQNVFGNQINRPANITINNRSSYNLNSTTETWGSNIVLNGTASISNVLNLILTPPVTITENGFGVITGGGSMFLGAGPTTIAVGPADNLYVAPVINGTTGITKTGPGQVFLFNANTYTGPTAINAGYLWASNSLALGATNGGGVVVSNGASLTLEGGITISNKALTLNGTGPTFDWGNLDSEPDFTNTHNTNGWTGPVTLNADSTVMPYDGGIKIILSGPISGPGGLLVNTGPLPGAGTLTLSGTNTNTFSGTTTLGFGVLELGKSGFDPSVQGPLVIGDNTDPANSAIVRLLFNNQINNTSTVTINSSGLLDENGAIEGIGGLNGTGNVTSGALLDFYGSGTYEFDGVISGTATIDVDTAATHVWTGNNTYTGSTIINQGTVRINGSQPASPVTVGSAATLGGNGTIGNLTCAGTLAPGPASGVSPGIFTCSNLVFTSTGKYVVDLTGPYAGMGFDQVVFRGTNAMGNATLQLLPSFSAPLSVGQQLQIVESFNGSTSSGIFNGLPSGSHITLNNYQFAITYDTINDVILTVLAIPGAAGSASVSSGDGNHSIDPNDCNNLSLSISNSTGTPMTGVTATLSTTTQLVLVTQPYSPYPDVPANGSSTNSAPFQISTLSNFVCGTPINLQLSVNSSLGAFTVPFTLTSGSLGAATRYDVSGNVSIPDVGSIDSTNVVSGFTGKLDKVTVALFITHPFDSDLTNISLISPDGTTVLLSSANGSGGANYGANCSPDSSRTTFDDAAATSITNGVAPFTGTFRPQGSLSNFIGNATPNGNWRLHIADGFGGSLGTLRCWSLFLYPIACSSGSGVCDTCTTPIVSAVTSASAVQTNRWFRENVISSCAVPKAWGGFGATGTNYHYNLHSFPNNTGADACVTVLLQSSNSDVMAGAYLNAYEPTNIAVNFLADSGNSIGISGGSTTFSCTVPSGDTLLVEVNEATQNSGTQPYTLTVAGLPCPPPTLAINEGPTNSMLLTWPTSAGGFNLEGSPGITTSSWALITNEPVIVSNKFTVTNSVPADHYFRLHKP